MYALPQNVSLGKFILMMMMFCFLIYLKDGAYRVVPLKLFQDIFFKGFYDLETETFKSCLF